MIKIVEYNDKYAKEMSKIIVSNLYEINIKDHGKDVIDRISKFFTEKEIKENFPNRAKCFVAIDNEIVVGTASIDRFRGDNTGTKYIILTVFVRKENHKQGIGKALIKEIEKYAIKLGVRELIVPASVYGCEFYRKLGYDYLEGKKEQNEDKEYMLVKYFN